MDNKKSSADIQYQNLLCRIFIENAKDEYKAIKQAFKNGKITARLAYELIVGDKKLRTVLKEKTDERTGTGTYKTFGNTIRINLKEGFPLLTTKKTEYRSALEELFWIISGDTNIKRLVDQSVHNWDSDCYKAYLTKQHLIIPNQESPAWRIGKKEFIEKIKNKDRKDPFVIKYGDIGPAYGAQLRNYCGHDLFLNDINNKLKNAKFSEEFNKLVTEYNLPWKGDKGVDQLADVIKTLKTNPNDRRMLAFMYNPKEKDQQVLPPCVIFYQFYVKDNELSVRGDIRSQDMFLGCPFDLISGAAFTHMIAQITGYEVGEYIHNTGDTHVYDNHLEQAQEQLSREPFEAPMIELDPSITNIENFDSDNVKIKNYKYHDPIKAKISV